MKHRSARHEDAKSRRDRLWNERQLQFTARTQPGNRIEVRPSTGLTTSKRGNQASENTSSSALGPHFRTEMQLQLAALQSLQRVQIARKKQLHEQKSIEMAKQLRQQRNEDTLKRNAKTAVKRLHDWNEKQKLDEESELAYLLQNIKPASEAIHLAQLLSSRWKDVGSNEGEIMSCIPRHSRQEMRVQFLLGNKRIGAFYP
uniref:AlNc14C203G8748 protein n=1 Tax=Albugo laibachii Nc14 TaxID=890382 RepID=F0W7X0_9STRA|nr:AlNc14C32G2920 [Albugo laibachii Nc14]CCA23698.1 AlNc14C203G8748 [Albugo laibachii Nc14]|eukprot:CCA23698.1 AlNc14C203G8748 [Albugo laibachii Nc14]